MRLTLRTLLAYLDDVLEPSQTKEIGQKIQESPVAAALVSRVREVIRRRRLGAPDVKTGKDGVDPNVVAQYLDNTLREDRVADIERVCLESDIHLAEVAACHQILTLVLGEPVEVPQQRLDRFYALGPVSADAQLTAPGEAVSRSAETLARSQAALVPDRSFNEGLPDYLKPAPWSQRFAPAAFVALLVVAAVAVFAFDQDLAKTLTGSRDATEPPSAVPIVPAESLTRPEPPKPPNPAVVTAQVPPRPADQAALPLLPPGIDPPPPADVPETPASVASITAPAPATVRPERMPSPPVSALPETTPPTPANPTPQPPPPDASLPPVQRIFVPMQYTSTEGVLIRYDRSDSHWYVQPRRSELHAEEILASPEPFEAAFDLDNGRLQATLLGDTVVQILPATPTHRIRLGLHRGRVILARGPAAPAEAPLSFELATTSQSWVVELAPGRTQCGLECQIADPAGLPFPAAPNWSRVALVVAEGQVSVTGPNAPAQPVPAPSMVWLQRPPAEANTEFDSTPEWLDPKTRNSSATLRRYAMLFEREFDAAAAVDLSLPALAKDPRPKIAELATRCLGTMETNEELIRALVRSEHAEARAAAAQGLRGWLVQDPARADLLKEDLTQHYPGEERTAVYRLLVGFSPKDAQDHLTSLMIVEWLRSNFVEVRELAIDQLQRLTGRRYDYRPLGSPSQREPGVQRWLGHVEREGALVKPE